MKSMQSRERSTQPHAQTPTANKYRSISVTVVVLMHMSMRVVLRSQGKWQLALDLVGRMKADGVTPTLTTYSSAADACAKGGNW